MSKSNLEQAAMRDQQSPGKEPGWLSRSFRPFRTATLRGLAIILPPLLTIIFFIWAWNVIESYLLRPIETSVTNGIAYYIEDFYDNGTVEQMLEDGRFRRRSQFVVDESGQSYSQLSNGRWIPSRIHDLAVEVVPEVAPASVADYFRHYVKTKHLKRHLFIPAFLALFLVVLYLLGKLLAAGIGRFFLHYFERLITQLPIIRNVYSSVKQVTDFAINENEMTFTRIVAVEYPRRGIWSMGFVTGEGMLDIKDAAGEPILTILMPTSPMPATGFTISVPKSEAIDLNITIDQAVQFCVSCGVVIPDHQQVRSTIDGELRSKFRQIADESAPASNGSVGDSSSSEDDAMKEEETG